MMKTLVNPSSTNSRRKKTLSVLNPKTNNRTPSSSRSTLDIKNRLVVRIASVRQLPQRDTHKPIFKKNEDNTSFFQVKIVIFRGIK